MLPSDFASTMLGTFRGLDDIRPSRWADPEQAPVQVTGVLELNGALLVQRWRESRSTGAFEGVNIFMTDPATGELLLYSFDTLGFPADPPARGHWRDGQVELLRETDRGQARATFAATATGFCWSKTYRPHEADPWTPVVTGSFTNESSGGDRHATGQSRIDATASLEEKATR